MEQLLFRSSLGHSPLAAKKALSSTSELAGGPVGAIQTIQEVRSGAGATPCAPSDFEDFFENGAIALHLVGPDGCILRANRAELELLGYSAEEYIGQHIARFHADQHVIENILARLSRG